MVDYLTDARAARALASRLLQKDCEQIGSKPWESCIYRQWVSNNQTDRLEYLEVVNPDLCCRVCRRWVLAETLAQDLEAGLLISQLPPSVRERLVRDAKTQLQRQQSDNCG